MHSLTWIVGAIKILQIPELEAGEVIQEVIPNATKKNILKIEWLRPHFADEQGNLKALVQAFVVDTGEMRILVDTCVGNNKNRSVIPQWGNLQTDFLQRLEAQGYRPDLIDIVLCTHLHLDHVGWNTMLVDGKWVPTFPKARYLMAEAEYQYFSSLPSAQIEDNRAAFRDSVHPVAEAGLVDLVATNARICDGISLIPTPGHTPAHVSVLIESRGQRALITGDILHHPCQMAYPEWETIADTDKEQAKRSRRLAFERFADTPTLIIGSHFAAPTAGYLKRDHTGFRLMI